MFVSLLLHYFVVSFVFVGASCLRNLGSAECFSIVFSLSNRTNCLENVINFDERETIGLTELENNIAYLVGKYNIGNYFLL